MDRTRGESKNWYLEPLGERQRMMKEHGLVGRRYAGAVKQIISGSVGFDDWEWGVDLFAGDPVVFKKLIYEMRFDEVSAAYAQFGQFFIGIRRPLGPVGPRCWTGRLHARSPSKLKELRRHNSLIPVTLALLLASCGGEPRPAEVTETRTG